MILGIDSSDDYVSVGLSAADGVVISRSSGQETRNKNVLHSLINRVLADASIPVEEIDGVAVAIGPGSFTGLRVGLSAAKGLCWAGSLPVAGVSSIAGILGCFGTRWNKLLVVKDARRDEFYYGGFERDNQEIKRIVPDSVGSADEILSLHSGGFSIAGPGLPALRNSAGAALNIGGIEFSSDCAGGEIARCGREMILSGRTLSLSTSSPVYIRIPGFREVN